MKNNQWRLLIDKASDGAWNMAVDEAILEFAANRIVPPTMRLYAWQPHTLSLGRAQPAADADLERLKAYNWGLVRRPTGGRAILHADELTYSVCSHEDNVIVHGGVLESYRNISRGLIEALRLIGIKANFQQEKFNKSHKTPDPVCFQDPSAYEITFEGKKIIGSAQARKKHGVLQHGAIPLFGDISRITDVLAFQTDDDRFKAGEKLKRRASTLSSILERDISWDDFKHAIVNGFSNAHGVEFKETGLSIGELQLAKKLFHQKYLSADWTYKI
jgi:lipoate-protein ligase A